MQNSEPQYEVYALRYATMQERKRSANFIAMDPHDGPMPMDYFVWLIRSPERAILVDTGFNAAAAKARGRTFLRCPIDALCTLNVEPATISDVVLTHLHYDHAGNLGKLPNARFHIQDAEVQYATGRCMTHGVLRHAYSVDDVVELVRDVYADRVVFHEGDADLAPGIQLKLIGGHTRGLQAVRVRTQRGWVVLASDASHYYENMESKNPFPIVYNVGDMLAGYQILAAAADSRDHIIPGHDPDVLKRYPATSATAPDVVSLHCPPVHSK